MSPHPTWQTHAGSCQLLSISLSCDCHPKHMPSHPQTRLNEASAPSWEVQAGLLWSESNPDRHQASSETPPQADCRPLSQPGTQASARTGVCGCVVCPSMHTVGLQFAHRMKQTRDTEHALIRTMGSPEAHPGCNPGCSLASLLWSFSSQFQMLFF